MSSVKRAGFVAVLVLVGCWWQGAVAGTLYVNGASGDDAWNGRCGAWDGGTCGPKATIQAGIDAAVAGDEVVIADGTYTGTGNRNLDFGGKAITVRSASGNPALCIIDCERSGRGFYFHSGEGAVSVVHGLTIRNGYPGGDSGGGVYCYASSSPTLANCTITGNTAGTGAGVSCSASACPTLTNCTITGNAAGRGGGVFCSLSSPTLTNCTITGNMAVNGGGGMLCSGTPCNPILTDCTIAGNSAAGSSNGGGVCCSDCYSGPTLINCTITGNNASGNGGGVYCAYSRPPLINCTIAGNNASSHGGGVFCDEASRPQLSNCILWADTPQEIFAFSGAAEVTYCDIQGGWNGTGNINAAPGFAFPTDFHLLPGSPCIDTGTNSPPGGLPAYDLDGQPRPFDGDANGTAGADMGAYEFNPATPTLALGVTELEFFVRQGRAGSKTLEIRNASLGTLAWALMSEADWLTADPVAGESAGEVDAVTLTTDTADLAHGTYVTTLWVNAPQAFNAPRAVAVILYVTAALYVPSEYATIQAAIDATTVPGDVVVVADGVYAGVGNKDLDFGGKAITVRSASGDPAACIIDCEGCGRGFCFYSRENAASIVQGLTIRNGYPGGSGGGVCCYACSDPTLTNCIITGNAAIGNGGGVFCLASSPTLTKCVISGNAASGSYARGGGMYCSSGSNPTLTHCTITGNTAHEGGGGVHCVSTGLTLTNCAITGNNASGDGGGVYCSGSSYSPILTNCTITGNNASGNGGGVYCPRSYLDATLTNCTIAGNTASNGGGVCSYSYSVNPKLTNCVFWANTPEEIFVPWGSPVVTYCDVQGSWAGIGNIDADPLFLDPDGPDNDPNTWADNDYHLSAASPCIDVGKNAAVPPDLLVDFDGLPRITDGDDDGAATVDMGAYERPAAVVGDVNCDGVVDTGDVKPFVAALIDPAQYVLEHPGCPMIFADCNNDGVVNFGDINPFIDLLVGR